MDAMETPIKDLEELEERLKTNSKNSSKPPSQDPYRKSRHRKKVHVHGVFYTNP